MPEPSPAPMSQEQKPQIGTAYMDENGTMFIQWRADDKAKGWVGVGRLELERGDPRYEEWLANIGPLNPGETVPMYAWGNKES